MAGEPDVTDVDVGTQDVKDVADIVEVPADSAVEVETTESGPTDDIEPVAAGLNPELLSRAESYGLSQSDVEGMDGGQLDRMFSAIDRRIINPQQQQQAVQQPGVPVPQQAAQVSDGQYKPFTPEFGDDLDESVIGPIKATVDHFNGALAEMHAFRQQAVQELQAMNVLREFSDFDRFVSGLGDDWTADYGSGATMNMDPQSKEFAKRLEVYQGAKTLLADAARRRQRMSDSDAWTRSHHATHWDRIAEQERKKLNGKLDKRRRGFSERPTTGKTPAMSPHDAAVEVWTK